MAYQLDFALVLGAAKTGLTATLKATLVDTTGAAVGGQTDLSGGFVEFGATGNYLWNYASMPDNHRGGVVFHTGAYAGTPVILAFSSINPSDAELPGKLLFDASNNVKSDVEAWKTVVPNGTIGGRIDANAQVVGDKTAYSLSSSGLDSVAAPADITNDADARSSFIKMVRALFNRFYNQVTQTSTQQKVYDDSTTLRSTMTVSDDGITQTKGKSS